MATRQFEEDDIRFDHACQFFTSSDPKFISICHEWQEAGIIAPWCGRLVTWKDNSVSPVVFGNGAEAWIGIDGMQSIPAKVLREYDGVEVHAGAWVSALVHKADNTWDVMVGNKRYPKFDYVVIAHNGKCANRLTGSRSLEAINKVLVKLRLSSIWVLAVGFSQPIPVDFDCAFVEGSSVLSCVCNQRSKFPSMAKECWVLLSDDKYGKRNKAPQEFIPDEVADRIAGEMLTEFARIAKLAPGGLPMVTFKRIQLWGAGLPLNVLQHSPMILDPRTGAAICGDWCVEPSVQGAVLSGHALADAIHAHRDGCTVPYLSASFLPIVLPHPIGAFPGLDGPPQSPGTAPEPVAEEGGGRANAGTGISESAQGEKAGRGGDAPIGDGKWRIRQDVWDALERFDLVDFPRPCHRRIPNFKGAAEASRRLAELDCFQRAKCVEVNPDVAQAAVRTAALELGKQVLVPSPRLKLGLFSMLDCSSVPPDKRTFAATQAGLRACGRPVTFSDPIPHVDLIVVGSVAVSLDGFRLGKGEGFADLEYAILREKGAVDATTLVATTVHDHCVRDVPVHLLQPHDVPVDLIVTPTKVIFTGTKLPRPPGLLWDALTLEKVGSIAVLRELQALRPPPASAVGAGSTQGASSAPANPVGGRGGGQRGRARRGQPRVQR
eukprot:EG_transcript_3926